MGVGGSLQNINLLLSLVAWGEKMIVFSFKDSRKLRLLCWVGSLCWLRLWSGGWHSGTLQLIQKPGWALHVGGFWEPGPQVPVVPQAAHQGAQLTQKHQRFFSHQKDIYGRNDDVRSIVPMS